MHLAPPGCRVRLMEPGEAEGLRALGLEAGLFGPAAPDLSSFVRWLLTHEVFVAQAGVAQAGEGRLAGFAASRDAADLYWLSGLAVAPAFKGHGIRKALLGAVVQRAGWFFHRAVGLAAVEGEEADWYRRRRFLSVTPNDLTGTLAALRAERPGIVPGDEGPFAAEAAFSGARLLGCERTVMIHWL